MVSEQGLNVYGAVTWGQFFVYQGFNARNGWMHTSYGGDAIDEYAETIVKKPDGLYYRYGGALRKLQVGQITIPFKQGGRPGASNIHRVSQPSRPHRPRRQRPVGSRSSCCRIRCRRWRSRTCAPRRRTMRRSAKSRTCAPILPTIPCTPTRTAQSPTSMEISFPEARPEVRFHPSGGRQQSRDRMARSACDRRDHHAAQPEQRVDPKHQQLAVLGSRLRKPEARRLSGLHVDQG